MGRVGDKKKFRIVGFWKFVGGHRSFWFNIWKRDLPEWEGELELEGRVWMWICLTVTEWIKGLKMMHADLLFVLFPSNSHVRILKPLFSFQKSKSKPRGLDLCGLGKSGNTGWVICWRGRLVENFWNSNSYLSMKLFLLWEMCCLKFQWKWGFRKQDVCSRLTKTRMGHSKNKY